MRSPASRPPSPYDDWCNVAEDGLAELRLRDYQPRTAIRTAVTAVPAPAHEVVDAHNHLGRWLAPDWLAPDVAALLRTMDAAQVRTVVNLDGRWGDELQANLDRYDRAHPGRFVTFCHADWSLLARDDGPDLLVEQLRQSAADGAAGLKVWKDLGLEVRDELGMLVLPDDWRLHRLFATAGELGLPVLIHTADPVAFFQPLDRHNERLDELGVHPEWWFGGDGRPTFDELIGALDRLIGECPGTTFIGAHMGCAAEDLARVDAMLTAHPNYVVDTSGRMGELGRQPRATARLIARHPDRVLFGSDAYPLALEDYQLWFRFLETADECFDYSPGEAIPPQGRWQVAALDLAADLLPNLYAGNARRVLGLPASA